VPQALAWIHLFGRYSVNRTMDIRLTRFVMLSEECTSRSEGHPQPKHPYL
jgi:hypothetical protein